MMKTFLKDLALAIAVQAILVGATWMVVFLFQLPNDTLVLQWLRIYVPTTILVMGFFMLFTTTHNLILALGLGFLLGAFCYGVIFTFIASSYRKHKMLNQDSKILIHETNSPENIIE